MNRKEFRNLVGEMSNLLEETAREEKALEESASRSGNTIAERIRVLKDLAQPARVESKTRDPRKLKQEETYSDDYKPLKDTEGLAAVKEKGPKGWSDDSSKPRTIPQASLTGGGKKNGGLSSKLKDSGMDPLDMQKRSGRVAPEEPEAEGAPEGGIDMPEEYNESMRQFKLDWKRLIGEDLVDEQGGNALSDLGNVMKTRKPVPPPVPARSKPAPMSMEDEPTEETPAPRLPKVTPPSGKTPMMRSSSKLGKLSSDPLPSLRNAAAAVKPSSTPVNREKLSSFGKLSLPGAYGSEPEETDDLSSLSRKVKGPLR